MRDGVKARTKHVRFWLWMNGSGVQLIVETEVIGM